MKTKLKRTLLFSLLIMLLGVLFCFNASALDSTGNCGYDGDDVTWSYDWQKGELVISGNGYMDDYDLKDNISPFKGSDVKTVIIEAGVKDVGAFAFYGCSKLTTVKLPESIEMIGGYSFSNCTALLEANLPSKLQVIGEYAFYGCTELEGGHIPEGVWYIDEYAFYNCESFSEIYIPGTVTSIGRQAFYNCNSAKNIILGEGIVEIGGSAFQLCTSVKKLILPKSLGYIGSRAFYISSCKEVTFQSSITNIAEDAFYSSVKKLNLLEGVEAFEFASFKDISEMEITVLNRNLDVYPFEMGSYSTVYCYNNSAAHKGASRKDKIYVSLLDVENEGTTTGGTYQNITYTFNSGTGTLTISGTGEVPGLSPSNVPWASGDVKKLVFTSGITKIGTGFNNNFPNLEEVTIPGTVSTLEEDSFKNCSKLKKMNLAEGLKTIKTGAIWYCDNLEEVVFPASVTMIETYSVFSHYIERVIVLNPSCTMGHYQYGISNENVVAEETVVYGYSGSTAETYADKYKRTFKLYCPHNNRTEQAAVEPTCTSVGYTSGTYCNDCKTWFTGHEIKPVLHDWQWATCAAPKNCKKCKLQVGPALEHSFNPATCTEPETCKNCGYKQGNPNGHSPEVVNGKEATCLETGLTDGEKCSVCNVTLVERKETPIGDHTPQTVPARAATCTKVGLTAGKECGVCGKVLEAQKEVPKVDHVPEDYEGRSPTCIREGIAPGKKCRECGIALSGMESIPLSDHAWLKANCVDPKTCAVCGATEGTPGDHNWEPATCTEPSTCPGCNGTKGEPLGHDYVYSACNDFKYCKRCEADEMFERGHNWEAATCLDPRTCETCRITDGEPLSHQWNDATCTVAKTCAVCNTTEGEPKGHSWTNGNCEVDKICAECLVRYDTVEGGHREEVIPEKPATCNEPGATEGRKCYVCGEYLRKPGVTPVLGHDWVQASCESPKTCTRCKATEGTATGHREVLIKGKPANCTQSGLTDGKKCTVCGKITAEQREIPALGHKIVTIPGKEPTCEEKGLTDGKSCAVCYVIIAAQQELPLVGHKWVDANCEKPRTCTVCRYTETTAAGHIPVTVPAVPATYTSAGKTEGKKCSVCGTILSAQRKVARKKLKKVTGLKVKKTTSSSVKLSWKKVTGAESYKVYYSTDGKKWKSVKATKNSVTVKKLSAAKNYQFKVKAVAGKYSGSASSVVKTATKFTTATLSKVISSKKKTAAVSWKKVKNASGYVVEYSTSKKFTKKTTKTVTVKKGKTTKTTLKKLTSGKKYYVRVKAYKTVNGKNIYSSYSAVKTVKVK